MSLMVSLAYPVKAQVAAAGSQLLSQGPGARAAALAGAVVSTVHDPTALYWNPAGLSGAGGALTAEHLFLFGGARYDFIGLSVPSPLGTFGIGVLQLNRDNIVARTAIDDPGYDVSNTQSVYMAGYGINIGRHWSAGATANVLDFNLAGYSGMGWGLDAGTQGRYWADQFLGLNRVAWNVGADVKNLIEPSVTLIDAADTYPREFRAGAAMSFQTASRPLGSGVIEHDRAGVMVSFSQVAGAPGLEPAIGLDYDYLHILTVRLGFDGYLSTGFGLRTPDGRFEFDYSMSDKPLSLDNRFALTYRFAPPKARPEEIYQEVVDEEFEAAKAEALEAGRQNYAQGEEDFKNQAYPNAENEFAMAAFLEPDSVLPEKALRLAKRARRLDEISRLSHEDTLNPGPGQEEPAYDNITDLLNLDAGVIDAGVIDAGGADRLLRVLEVIRERVGDAAYDGYCSAAFDKGNLAARRLLAVGRVQEARQIADTLKVVESSATAPEVAALEQAISTRSSSLRGSFDRLYGQDQNGATPALARAALAALRAVPGDRGEVKKARKALRRYREQHPEPVRESFYLQKLYYLAALAYANRTQGSLGQAQDYLTQILSDDPADAQADRLLDAVSLAASVSDARVGDAGPGN